VVKILKLVEKLYILEKPYIKKHKYYKINKVGRSKFKISGAQCSFGFVVSKLAIQRSRKICYVLICGHVAFSIVSMFFPL